MVAEIAVYPRLCADPCAQFGGYRYYLCVWGLLFTRMENSSVYPANFYEKQIPGIKEYIREENTALLDPSRREALEAKVPAAGFLYQVVDGEGDYIYGTFHDQIFAGKRQLYDRLNTVTGLHGRYVQTVPVIGGDGRISGAVLLSYTLSPTYAEGRGWLAAVYIAILLSPFFTSCCLRCCSLDESPGG